MVEGRTIGEILTSLGRISEDDVRRALDYQRDNGGYFGQALLACGVVSAEEVEWGLASQYDLPYVFPDADSIDPQAATLVSPEWALSHLTLPIMKTDETLSVIVESPLNTEAVEELHARTGLRIELALASAGHIRDLIRQVHARGSVSEQGELRAPMHLADAFRASLEAASTSFGISRRGHRAWAWWDDAGTIRRRPLEGLWEIELDTLLSPPSKEQVGERLKHQWTGELSREGVVAPVDVRYLADESGAEYLFRPVSARSSLHDRFTAPSPAVQSEIQLLTRSGSARFVVTSEPAELGHEILPHLPALLLDPSWRSIYINAGEQAAAEEAFSVPMPPDPDAWASELETLRGFHFDVVTVDLTGNESAWAETALDVASVAFLLWPTDADRGPALAAGIRWELRITRGDDGRLDWTLEPLHS